MNGVLLKSMERCNFYIEAVADKWKKKENSTPGCFKGGDALIHILGTVKIPESCTRNIQKISSPTAINRNQILLIIPMLETSFHFKVAARTETEYFDEIGISKKPTYDGTNLGCGEERFYQMEYLPQVKIMLLLSNFSKEFKGYFYASISMFESIIVYDIKKRGFFGICDTRDLSYYCVIYKEVAKVLSANFFEDD